jgi:hypothetical protein
MKRPAAPPSSAIAALACLLACVLLAAPAGAAPTYQKESEAEFRQQLAAGQIREATINKRIRTIRIVLRDGSRKLARYPAKQEPRVRAELKAKRVKVTVLTPAQSSAAVAKKPVHHKLRYIVGGIALGAIVIAGGVLLYNRRRLRD